MKKFNVNILTAINSSTKITKETINNKEYIIIRDVVPVVDNVVMNNGLYPKDEVDRGYLSINGNLMPLGHPKIDGKYVSASNPKAINEFYGGAWAENVRKQSDKVLLDTHVDVEYAKNHEKGQLLLNRLEQMMNGENTDPIHVSTGLILNKEYKSGKSKGKSYSWIARNMQFDHVAILLNEQGAATPNEGVGIFVNSDGEIETEIANLNESQEADSEDITQKVVNKLLETIKAFMPNKKEETDPMKEAILQALNAKGIKTDGLSDEQLLSALNEQAAKDAIDKKKAEEDEANKKKEEAQNSEQAPAWAKAIIEEVNSLKQTVNANAVAEQNTMREAVKAKFGMTDTAVNALSGEPLKELYAQCQTSVSLNSSFIHKNSNQSVCDMPE